MVSSVGLGLQRPRSEDTDSNEDFKGGTAARVDYRRSWAPILKGFSLLIKAKVISCKGSMNECISQ